MRGAPAIFIATRMQQAQATWQTEAVEGKGGGQENNRTTAEAEAEATEAAKAAGAAAGSLLPLLFKETKLGRTCCLAQLVHLQLPLSCPSTVQGSRNRNHLNKSQCHAM